MAKSDYIYTDPTVYLNGQTPFTLYDDDNTFKTDAVNVTKWVAQRLGHPVMQLEMNSGSIYAMFQKIEKVVLYIVKLVHPNLNIQMVLEQTFSYQNNTDNLQESVVM